MNIIQIDVIILLSILWLVAIAIIVADRIKYRKYYSSKGKMVVLRINNPDVRDRLNSDGLSLSASVLTTIPTSISTPSKVIVSVVLQKNAPI